MALTDVEIQALKPREKKYKVFDGDVPAEGRVVVVTPFFEEPSIRETLRSPGDVRPWKEDESPFELLAGALRERAAA